MVSASAISDYLYALRAHRSLQAGYILRIAGSNLRLPKQLRQMRREDGPAGQRALSRELTARLLRKGLASRRARDWLRARYSAWPSEVGDVLTVQTAGRRTCNQTHKRMG